MRIGIDYRPAWAHAPGVGRYTRELVRALAKLPAPPELALFELGDPQREVDDEALGLAGSHAIAKRVRGPLPRRAVRVLGRFGLSVDRLLGGVELFQHTADRLPVRFARQCTAVAELPPRGTPQFAAHAAWLRSLDGLLVFSAHAAQRLVDECGADPTRVHFTPVGCEHWRRELPASALRRPTDDAAPLRVIALGALRSDARPLVLLEACERLRAGGLEVELTSVGRAGDAAEAWTRRRAASPLGEAVRWISEPRESELPGLVARADVLVQLEEEVLTPVTALEACSLGPAVVAARQPVLREALGELAEWTEPGAGPDALADALASARPRARDEAERERRQALAERFDWRGCALATQLAWRRILSPRGA
ncbi:MAG: glycosyltransferase [Planctomycetes bacterium]|nr:glycosyltransferase [Planctomycetota bacterium]MCB9904233.1 glycosyltransferase [Planctomycetota bacterium]